MTATITYSLKITCISIALLFASLFLNAQVSNGTISGTIITSDGGAAAAVNVGIKELNKAAITAENGTYQLKNVKPGTYTLKVSFVGILPQEQQVIVRSAENTVIDFRISESSAKLQEVTITAVRSINKTPVAVGKVAINPMDLPQSISIVSNQVITDQQANRLSDVIRNVNGVSMADTRGATSETFFARGYNLGANNILKNGARSNSAVIPEASTLEKVEVLKGSAALLYGTVSSGAVINMVTKKPKFEYGGEVSMRSGSYEFYKPTIDLYGPISKKLAFRVVSTYEDSKSYRKNVQSDRIYINPSFLYNIGSKTNLLVQGDYMNHNLTPDFGIGTLDNTAIPTNLSRSASFNTPWAYNKASQVTSSVTLNHNFNSNWNVNISGAFQSFDRNYFSTERIQAKTNGDWGRKLSRVRISEDYFNTQANLTGKFTTGSVKHQALAGTDAEQYINISNAFKIASLKAEDVYDSINIVNPLKFTPRVDEPSASNTTRTKAPTYRVGIYFQDLISISEKLKVLAGLRWSYQKIGIARITNVQSGESVENTNSATKVNDYDQAFSPRFGIVFHPVKSTSLFASYSNNFVPNPGIDIETKQNMKASFVNQYEVGIKNDFLNGRLSANVSVYKIVNSNLPITSDIRLTDGKPGNTDSNIKQFVGQTTSEGIELDLSGSVNQNLNFLAGYSYNYMRVTKGTDQKNSFIEGERLVNNPANTANASLFYTFNAAKIKGLKVGASGFYIGNRNGGYNNRVGQAQTYNRLIPLKGYATFDLSLGYSIKKLSLLTKVSNITDELSYIVHENYSVNPIPPRQFVTTLSYKF
ncbi:MAG: TonB-dependent receptor [Sphingobacteriaceae bacterium]|nr:TonB-dependent receptor [Sphingobacteriaceae bacterium]